MTDQEIRGKVNNLKGRVKEAAGIVTGNVELENEGAAQRIDGAVDEGVGKVRRKVGQMIENVADKIKE